MNKELVGTFDLMAFNTRVYRFEVYSDNTMSCKDLELENITKLYLKPRFELSINNRFFKLPYNLREDELICDMVYDDDLFQYLCNNRLISFSTDMAYLYDLPVKEGYDIKFIKGQKNSGTPYKWASKKGPVLQRQKQGQFN